MQLQKKYIFFFFLLLSFYTHSQKEASIWYFGERAGLNFNNGSNIQVTDGEMLSLEGCATVSDEDGNLLFYTNGGSHEYFINVGKDGGTIWNKNHEPMYQMNGMEGGGFSATQSSLILPKPNNPGVYYLMVIDEIEAYLNNELRGFSYYEIDMNLNGGLGEVTTYVESVYANTYELLSAVPMTDETGFWVVIRDKDSEEFLVYALTESGINLNGTYPGTGFNRLTFSPDGSKLFSAGYLYDFDKLTGDISNELELTLPGVRGFSPNSRYLYSIYFDSIDINRFDFHRYDLSVSDINASATFLFSVDNVGVGNAQIAPDGNMYFIERTSSFDTAYLAAILCPNSETPCFKRGIYSFPITNYLFTHLPNFNDHAFASDTEQITLEASIDASALIIGPGETVTLTANHYLGESYLWSTNETTQSITIDQPGIYSVTISDGCCSSGTAEIEVVEDITDDVIDLDLQDYVIFPNPAKESFNIVFEDAQNFELTLFDALGRVILPPVEYIEQARIETRNLPSGTLWLKIKLDGKLHWERVDVVR